MNRSMLTDKAQRLRRHALRAHSLLITGLWISLHVTINKCSFNLTMRNGLFYKACFGGRMEPGRGGPIPWNSIYFKASHECDM